MLFYKALHQTHCKVMVPYNVISFDHAGIIVTNAAVWYLYFADKFVFICICWHIHIKKRCLVTIMSSIFLWNVLSKFQQSCNMCSIVHHILSIFRIFVFIWIFLTTFISLCYGTIIPFSPFRLHILWGGVFYHENNHLWKFSSFQ